MRKVGIILIVCLLAVAGITAAMAYQNAYVTSPGVLNIVETDSALLAFEPHRDYADEPFWIDEGMLKFRPGHPAGLQPNSHYIWTQAFKVTNKSGDDVKVSISEFDAGLHQTGVKWRIHESGTGVNLVSNSAVTGNNVKIEAGEYTLFSVRITVDPGTDFVSNLSGDIVFLGAKNPDALVVGDDE